MIIIIIIPGSFILRGRRCSRVGSIEQGGQVYAGLSSQGEFVPIAVESHGPISRDALQFLSELGSWRLVETTGDVRASSFLIIIVISSQLAASNKVVKYARLSSQGEFLPIAVESQGPISRDSLQFLSELGSWRLVETTSDVRAYA